MTLDSDDIDAIAQQVAARLTGRGLGLVTVEQLARELQVERSWVYARWRELGGFKLGDGRNAPIRFDLAAVRERLQRAHPAGPASVPAAASRRPRTPPGDVQMLSARGS
ncbi:helix-turn-helix domain-containing protein [Capillimicrobium parvum]|uniref:Helix-turn-helix domain-containing protein n=1 Tax=Capillimicrobium parvum TaxID=2884022 RepID=A0A9E6XXJ4_9ACTN|nr:helix-turn-helix domain-containing protein [Capillimicrobium parvum]UGS36055.1 hypothetical protein DSM104329_02452 [Capillimicrobium parvum]